MYLSFPLFRLVSGNLGRCVWAHIFRVYKGFWVLGLEETLPRARQCNKLHSTICIVLLSEFVSQNAWLQHHKGHQNVYLKQTDCQIFPQERWVYQGLAENWNMGSVTMVNYIQVPIQQGKDKTFTERKRKWWEL